jgi:hypothetical protein
MSATLRDIQILRSVLGRLNAERRAERYAPNASDLARTLYQERSGVDWLRGTYADNGAKVVFRFSGMNYPVLLSDKPRALAIILGKASLHESVAEPSQRFALAPDALVTLLNKLLRWFARNDQQHRPLLIMDHVDKIRVEAAAEDVLVKVAPQWNRIEASIVMTAPLEYTLGPVRTSVESRWDKILMLYPLQTPELSEGGVPRIYSGIARSAGLADLISDDALTLLAHYSGGILRMFIQFLAEAAQEAHLAGHDRIELGEAHAVILRAEQAYLPTFRTSRHHYLGFFLACLA